MLKKQADPTLSLSLMTIRLKTEPFIIPRCRQQKQFFQMRNSKRKKKLSKLFHSDQFYPSTSDFPHHQQLQPAFEKRAHLDTLTTITSATTAPENVINFKNKHIKRKINKVNQVCGEKMSDRRFSDYAMHLPLQCRIQNTAEMPGKCSLHLNNFMRLRRVETGKDHETFLVIQKHTGFVCALKAMKKNNVEREVLIKQMKINMLLKGGGILNLYGVFDDEECVYLVTEYCTSADIAALAREKQMTALEISYIIRQVCEAMLLMHHDLYVHGSISAENISLTMDNVVKLKNFQLSAYCGRKGGIFCEQAVQKWELLRQADIFAIAMLAYQLLACEHGKELSIAADRVKLSLINNEMGKHFIKKLLDGSMRTIQKVLEHPFLYLSEDELE